MVCLECRNERCRPFWDRQSWRRWRGWWRSSMLPCPPFHPASAGALIPRSLACTCQCRCTSPLLIAISCTPTHGKASASSGLPSQSTTDRRGLAVLSAPHARVSSTFLDMPYVNMPKRHGCIYKSGQFASPQPMPTASNAPMRELGRGAYPFPARAKL